MTALAITSPLPQFFDLDGDPLNNGKLYFGAVNQNPETNPQTVYWDAALTQPAAQPVTVRNGYAVRSGNVAIIYAPSDYSLTIKDKRGRLVMYAANSAEFSTASVLAAYKALLAGTGSGQGASLVGVYDVAGDYTGTNQEAVDAEIGLVIRKWVTVTDPRFGGAVSGSWHTAIIAAGTYAKANSLGLQFLPQAGGYPTTAPATIPDSVPVDMTGSGGITYSGSRPAIALTIGTLGTYNKAPMRGLEVNMSTISWSGNTTTTYDDICIRLLNPTEADIRIRRVYGATIGYEIYSDAPQGVLYNTFRVDKTADCMFHEVLRTYASGGACINNNTFIGGSCANYSGSSGLGTGYGTVVTWNKSTGYRGQNSNLWINRAYEMGVTATRIPILLDGAGGYCRWINARHESNNGVFAYCDGGSGINVVQNVFEIGYSPEVGSPLPSITQVNGAFGNLYRPTREGGRISNVWHSGEMSQYVSGQVAATPYISGPFHFVQNSAAIVKTLNSTAIEVGVEGGVEYLRSSGFPIGVGVFFDASISKEFYITENCIAGFPGRIYVQCFDSTGAIMTNADPNYPNVRSGASLTYSTNFGGAYGTSSDTFNANSFSFGSTVQYARVFFVGGTNPLKLCSFSIAAIGVSSFGSPVNVLSGPGVWDDQAQRLSSANPTTAGEHGRYAVGNVVWSSAAGAFPLGWRCTTAGRLAKSWAASTVYAVGQIRKNGSNVYVCKTAGASAASVGPTGTGTGIADNIAVWDYLCPLAVLA